MLGTILNLGKGSSPEVREEDYFRGGDPPEVREGDPALGLVTSL